MRFLLLFDIDGTLILSGGAGARGLSRAFRDEFGVADAFAGIAMPGRTDDAILADALARAGLTADAGQLARFRRRYEVTLAEEIERPNPAKRVMPGIVPLLEALAARGDVVLGLLTGNYPEAACVKLRHFDLWHLFACGAYATEADDRNALAPVAIARARACGFRSTDPRDVLVVGDTPLDVACARSAGAVAVAVATGGFDAQVLGEAGADVVFPDLSDTGTFLRLLDGG